MCQFSLISRCSRRLAAILFLILVTFAAPLQRAHAEDDIVIGMSAAFTGPSRGLGIELYRGAMAAFEQKNKNGGIGGRKIVIKALDDGYNPSKAVDNTIRLVEDDKVLLLFGYVGTPTTARVLPLLKRYQDRDVLLFFPFTGAEPMRRFPYDAHVYNLRASYAQETAGLVDYFVKSGRKKIGVFYQVDAYGRSGWEGVAKGLAKHDLKMVSEASYRRGDSFDKSKREQVDILREAGADAVISIGAYGACAAFIRDARDAGWDVPIANVSFVGSEAMLSLLLEAGKANGKDYTKHLINSQVVPSYFDDKIEAVKRYRELMDRNNPAPPEAYRDDTYKPMKYSFVSLEGYLDAELLIKILEKAPTPIRPAGIRTAAASEKGFDIGLSKPVTFFRNGKEVHQASDLVFFTVVHDGHFVPLGSEKERP
jgi:ABC-type branched-subunit amino acid transport system substrate-binding protein